MVATRAQSGPELAAVETSRLGKVAFVRDGDIFVKGLPDGTPDRITRADANIAYSSPQWSPSGGWLLASTTSGQAAIMRPDGSDKRMLGGEFRGRVVWSPVDDRLAYVGVGEGGAPNELVVEDADGSARKVIARAQPPAGETGSLSDPTWSADGTYIAYVESHLGEVPPSTPPGARVVQLHTYEAIRVTSIGGMRPEELFVEDEPPQDGLGLLHWSRQGLLVHRRPAFSADVADGVTLELLNPRTVVTNGQRHFLPTEPVDFSPANPMILLDPTLRSTDNPALYAITAGGGRETWTGKRIAGLSWASGNVFDLTDPSVAAIQPAVSPGGRQIGYSAMPDTPDVAGGEPAKQALMQRKIWTMDAYSEETGEFGANNRQLTHDDRYRDEYPQWSADGARILFVRMDAQSNASLWLMNADGSDQREIVPRFDIVEKAAPGGAWFGYYGAISWPQSFAWWRPGQ